MYTQEAHNDNETQKAARQLRLIHYLELRKRWGSGAFAGKGNSREGERRKCIQNKVCPARQISQVKKVVSGSGSLLVQKGRHPYQWRFPSRKGNFYSVCGVSPVSARSQNNQLKMTLKPKRRIMVWCFLLPIRPLSLPLPLSLNIFYKINWGLKDLVYMNGKRSLFPVLNAWSSI